MIEPTVGRIVWYFGNIEQKEPVAAMIVKVWDNNLVNLVCYSEGGVPFPMTSVTLKQPETPLAEVQNRAGGWCEWMPYQQGQAAKTEQVQQQLEQVHNQAHADNGGTGELNQNQVLQEQVNHQSGTEQGAGDPAGAANSAGEGAGTDGAANTVGDAEQPQTETQQAS